MLKAEDEIDWKARCEEMASELADLRILLDTLLEHGVVVEDELTEKNLELERRRAALRKAFGHYLSPAMVDRIADENLNLAPGGVLVNATLMFTDLEGFTTFAEEMDDPAKLSDLLVEYFTQTTMHILEQDGTIIKFIGDAVMALWGAPIEQNDQATRGALAALGLQDSAARVRFEGQELRTRVGLHCGQVLVGNLGSTQRFDYTAIGDTTNFASRLEGLNKHFGTTILISESIYQQLASSFWVRPLGLFQVLGKRKSVQIYELLGETAPAPVPVWQQKFQQALQEFQTANFDSAIQLFEQVIQEREGLDGPSSFYLGVISSLRTSGIPEGWKGEVTLDSK